MKKILSILIFFLLYQFGFTQEIIIEKHYPFEIDGASGYAELCEMEDGNIMMTYLSSEHPDTPGLIIFNTLGDSIGKIELPNNKVSKLETIKRYPNSNKYIAVGSSKNDGKHSYSAIQFDSDGNIFWIKELINDSNFVGNTNLRIINDSISVFNSYYNYYKLYKYSVSIIQIDFSANIIDSNGIQNNLSRPISTFYNDTSIVIANYPKLYFADFNSVIFDSVNYSDADRSRIFSSNKNLIVIDWNVPGYSTIYKNGDNILQKYHNDAHIFNAIILESGNLLCLGEDIDAGHSNYYSTDRAEIIKLDSTGDEIWSYEFSKYRYNDPDASTICYDAIELSNGNLAISGISSYDNKSTNFFYIGDSLGRFNFINDTIYIEANYDVFNIHPNPASNNVTVSFKKEISGYIEITDLKGVVLFHEEFKERRSIEINIQNWENGTYAVSFKEENFPFISSKNLIILN